jgi:hypothetical protein
MNPFLRIAVDTLSDQTRDTDAFLVAQMATAYALIAIAEELAKINERAELEAERRELLETTEPDPQAGLHCTCGLGEATLAPEHAQDCDFYLPF